VFMAVVFARLRGRAEHGRHPRQGDDRLRAAAG
jgi:hypothetical protein